MCSNHLGRKLSPLLKLTSVLISFNSSQQSQNTRSETETVINELFGEELEKMDRDRLADRYDVLG